jgi:ATP-dependent DNA helicase RecG
MIALCAEAGLPAPEFRHDGGQFVLTLSRDSLTPQTLADAGLNERQKKAIAFIRTHRRVTNADYRELTGATRKTAARDLDDLVTEKLLTRVGTAGRGIIYTLPRKWDKNETNGTSRTATGKRDKNGTKGTRLTRTRKKADA